jgi:hypothetical protein
MHVRVRSRGFQDDQDMRAIGWAALGMLVGTTAASAWSPPPVGTPCRAPARAGEVTLVAGNYLGGRAQRNGVVDRKSFQACFRDIASCELWLARRAGDFPLQPGFATCVPLRISAK